MPENREKIHYVNGYRIGYTKKKMTSYGGFSMLAMFFEKIKLKTALTGLMPIVEVSPNAMKAEDKLLGYMTLIIAGGRRFSHLLYLGNPAAIKTIFGLERLPLASTVTR